MSLFRGYTCDSCGETVTESDVTTVTTRYEGPSVRGQRKEHRCVDCVGVKQDDLKPLRRSRAKASSRVNSASN